jgi:hypothetical protein
MGRGRWTRWGRDSCEGWSLDIGDTLRGQAVKNHDGSWRASVTSVDLGRHETRDQAKAAVERYIGRAMLMILEDWAHYTATKDGRERR